MTVNKTHVKPFLKWAGGKRWFVKNHSSAVPHEFNTYYEPFLGSGAVFFHLQPNHAVLADRNEELINTYIAIREDWKGVWRRLREHQRSHSEIHYYRVRKSSPRSSAGKAARLIYLNRTCFNGLYRVNRDGVFNVPKGTKDTVVFPDDDLAGVARTLKTSTIVCDDFASVIDEAKCDDLVYVDPPYTMGHSNNGFLKYNEKIFRWHDQVRLADVIREAHERGVKIVMSNANHVSIRRLYRDFMGIVPITRHSILAASSARRRMVTELLITNTRVSP